MITASDPTRLRGELLRDEPMARHTSWRVGGPAQVFYRPADLSDLSTFLGQLDPDGPLLWLGLGSNLLVRDGGFSGTVIAIQGRLTAIVVLEGQRIQVEAGAACAHVARLAARHGLSGGAFLAGIPGTMGGALAMNAGAFGDETWSRVRHVETVDRTGRIYQRGPEDYVVSYRQVTGPSAEWFVGCELQLQRGDVAREQQHIKELLAKRGATQPTNKPSGGSTFRNPPGDYAARLIEQAGLKGFCIGGAEVSRKHANFIVNSGAASAADIEALIDHIQDVVARAFGIQLIREVHIAGEAACV